MVALSRRALALMHGTSDVRLIKLERTGILPKFPEDDPVGQEGYADVLAVVMAARTGKKLSMQEIRRGLQAFERMVSLARMEEGSKSLPGPSREAVLAAIQRHRDSQRSSYQAALAAARGETPSRSAYRRALMEAAKPNWALRATGTTPKKEK